jgi:hypothetical protein
VKIGAFGGFSGMCGYGVMGDVVCRPVGGCCVGLCGKGCVGEGGLVWAYGEASCGVGVGDVLWA